MYQTAFCGMVWTFELDVNNYIRLLDVHNGQIGFGNIVFGSVKQNIQRR